MLVQYTMHIGNSPNWDWGLNTTSLPDLPHACCGSSISTTLIMRIKKQRREGLGLLITWMVGGECESRLWEWEEEGGGPLSNRYAISHILPAKLGHLDCVYVWRFASNPANCCVSAMSVWCRSRDEILIFFVTPVNCHSKLRTFGN